LKAYVPVLLLRWLLLLEEYGVTFKYLSVKKNVDTVTDALSRLEIYSLHSHFPQYQKTAASVISNQQPQYILP
jgi:hypothetical protein